MNGGDHQPMRRWLGRVKERVGLPHVVDVVDAEFGVFEQVCRSISNGSSSSS